MTKIKVLNLYAGIGGNRKLWQNVDVTAVEINKEIAAIYKDFFPEDNVIIGDAHQYLLEHYNEFDFIWASPPCPTHSKIRQFSAVASGQNKPTYPDMTLYQEIIFLMYNFKGKWTIENVFSYYDPLIKPFIYEKHYYWANFKIDNKQGGDRGMGKNENLQELYKIKGFDLTNYKNIDKRKTIRNCVEPKAALNIFNMAFKIKQTTLE